MLSFVKLDNCILSCTCQRNRAHSSRNIVPHFKSYTVIHMKSCHISQKLTMLQKLSKCEVKAWLCWDSIILLALRFYVKSKFGKFKWSKSVILANFRGSEFWFLVNLSSFKSQIYRISKFIGSKIAKNYIFGPFEFAYIWFHVKSEWWQ